ncbi:TPA: hypothetical protein EYN98_09405 [Candidatus Poribacteria bacterium]|nr:hypothetical protein [Candidatus Poribacteria bacterium]HIA66264.1 hypothetical protein [Candidatus Poribacteria bacterium]HIB88028.1 hypothetical protein [Candidatus Poribacteria bacterium]HIN30313.1 hypothetical protein [Candidatus Poribacteria bacterium]
MPRDIAQHLEDFKQNGLTVFESQLDEIALDRWRFIFQQELAQNSNQTPTGNRHDTYQLIEKYPNFALSFVSNTEVLDFLELLIGPFVSLEAMAFASTYPTTPEDAIGSIKWHRDMWASVGRTDDYLPPNAVNVLNYFPHIDPARGAFRFIPGSHRKSIFVNADQSRRPHPKEQLVYPKSGDTLFIHSGLLHSGTGNYSDEMRYFVSRFYAKCWYPRREQVDIPAIQSFIAEAELNRDRRLMRLFGKDDLLLSRAGRSGTLPEVEIWQKWVEEDRQYKSTIDLE